MVIAEKSTARGWSVRGKTRLVKLLERVVKREDFVSTRQGRPVAELVPVSARDTVQIKQAISEVRATARTGLARRRMRLQKLLRTGEALRDVMREGSASDALRSGQLGCPCVAASGRGERSHRTAGRPSGAGYREGPQHPGNQSRQRSARGSAPGSNQELRARTNDRRAGSSIEVDSAATKTGVLAIVELVKRLGLTTRDTACIDLPHRQERSLAMLDERMRTAQAAMRAQVSCRAGAGAFCSRRAISMHATMPGLNAWGRSTSCNAC